MKIEIDLHEDWRQLVIQNLSVAGYNPDISQSVDDITFQYYNLRKREIDIAPRKVLKSDVFSCPDGLKKSLNSLESDIENGKNLNGYLSRSLKNLDYDDALLNDWGIHHFHLGDERESDGFIKRTELLLFARVIHDTVYFIDVLSHGSWAKKQMIAVLHRNWPESLEIFKVKGALKLGRTVDDASHSILRKAGISTFVELDDGVIYGILGGGYTADGGSLEARRGSDKMLTLLQDIEEHVQNNIIQLVQLALDSGVNLISPLRFRLEIEGNKVFVLEENANTRFLMYEFK